MAHVRRARSGQGWEARYRDPHDRERSRTFNTKREATQFLARQLADVQRGDWLEPSLARITFDAWATEWLATTVHLKPKTRVGYESLLQRHVLPAFGDLRISAIEQIDVRRFVATMTAAGAEPGTVRNAFNVVRQVFNVAVAAGAVRSSPCKGVRMPRSVRQEMLFLDGIELRRLAAAIHVRYAALVMLAGYGGLRAGELGALRIARLDLRRGSVEVAESLAEVNGHLVFGETKTYARRTVRLPTFLTEMLVEHLERFSSDQNDLVFTGAQGAPIRHNLFYGRHFKPAAREAGLPSALRFHDLRHTCAALLIADAHPKAIMERLGHSSIQVTLDRYGHLLPSIDESLAEGLDATYRESLQLPLTGDSHIAALRSRDVG